MRHWDTIPFVKNKFPETAALLCDVYPISAFLTANSTEGWTQSGLVALGVWRSVDNYNGTPLEKLDKLISENHDWIFGHCGYNLKKETEGIDCEKSNHDGFEDSYFFVPEIVLISEENSVRVGVKTATDFDKIVQLLHEVSRTCTNETSVELQPTTSASEYLSVGRKLLQHIHRGDIYEINYCVDFTAYAEKICPPVIFDKLNSLSLAPFSALYRNKGSWLMCASPERYISKQGNRLFSQPIKGTRKRGKTTEEDRALIAELKSDKKERMENIMIVDLVRNDLSRIATKGSVQVSELCAVHTFKTVHQMISTVECQVSKSVSFVEILKATFPMGSMTGAPKIRAMQLAEQYESQSRGIYSGTLGYITPEGDFDFNVVIRSVTWNSETGHLSAKAGSAITAESIPEKEHEECLIKVDAMRKALKSV